MTSATATPAKLSAIAVLREQMAVIHRTLRVNTDGLSQQDALIQPDPAGNCLNWNVGHLVFVNNQILQLVGQPPCPGTESLKQYDRGSAPLRDPAAGVPLDQLLAAWDDQSARIDAGLASLDPERLDQPAPFSPRKKADETIGSLLSIVMFHQSYHVGQTGLLRRMAGKERAIQ